MNTELLPSVGFVLGAILQELILWLANWDTNEQWYINLLSSTGHSKSLYDFIKMSSNLERIMENYNVSTGATLAKSWMKREKVKNVISLPVYETYS